MPPKLILLEEYFQPCISDLLLTYKFNYIKYQEIQFYLDLLDIHTAIPRNLSYTTSIAFCRSLLDSAYGSSGYFYTMDSAYAIHEYLVEAFKPYQLTSNFNFLSCTKSFSNFIPLEYNAELKDVFNVDKILKKALLKFGPHCKQFSFLCLYKLYYLEASCIYF